mgnify:CR=1 FL=1
MAGGLVAYAIRLMPPLMREGKVVQQLAAAGIAMAFGLICCLGYMVNTGNRGLDRGGDALALLVPAMVAATVVSLVIASRKRLPGQGGQAARHEAGRLIWLLPVIAAMLLPYSGAVGVPSGRSAERLGLTLLAAGMPLLLISSRKLVWAGRRERLDLGPALLSGLYAAIAAWIFGGAALLAAGVAAGVSLVAQITAPFDPQACRPRLEERRRRNSDQPGRSAEDKDEDEDQDEGDEDEDEERERLGPAAACPAAPRAGRVRHDGHGGRGGAEPLTLHGAGRRGIGRPLPPEGVSDRKRLWALLMAFAGLLGVCGLQRFYAGKVVTGVIWLCTFGLAYFGQVWDIVMLALGEFRDRHGRRLLVWQHPGELWYGGEVGRSAVPQGARFGAATPDDAAGAGPAGDRPGAGGGGPPEGRPIPVPMERDSRVSRRSMPLRTSVFLAVPAGLLMAAGFLVGAVFVSLDLPEIIRALPDQGPAQELNDMFGYTGWPHLVRRIAGAVSLAAMLLGTLLALLARRRTGAAHVSRAMLGALGLLLTVKALSLTLAGLNWPLILVALDREQIGPALEMFMDQTDGRSAMVALGLLMVSVLLLGWPERRRELPEGQDRGA